ncbi:cardiolipin synthase [Sedimentibacter sp.]|uniref:cardiolipin synthase n=1 Tax=Sedimentibacter sp. TaxID=1960295 RepID=UPI0028AD5ABD|nr:cardiolipin synthase [Sedimentibacter sp.]
MQRILRIIFNRVTFVVLSILAQILTFVIIIDSFSNYLFIFNFLFMLISILVVIYILNSKSDPAYKIAWIIPIMLVPIFGGLFFLMSGGAGLSSRMKKSMTLISDKMKESLSQNERTVQMLLEDNNIAYNQAKYIEKYTMCPVYNNSYTELLPSGESFFESLVNELERAEKYIFLEFFIIEEGLMWNTILDVLIDKVRQGVEVRVIYDDFGGMFKLPLRYNKKLEEMGIKCCVFNPIIPIMSIRLNNRDHRKIVVIDGKVAFTGGVNIADEYINKIEKFGHWRDCAIKIEGDAVWSLTAMFLSVWSYLRKEEEDYSLFMSQENNGEIGCCGFVQPFDDSPLDDEHVSEAVYMNLINQAQKYIYIETPYLIADNKMMIALSLAAKRGVDVRILTPHIPDKKYAFAVTRSNYEELLESGVSIYEYTPGFNHGKTFVVDDTYAVVGTINLDYRSLYLHFECGVWLYNSDSVLQVKENTLNALCVSQKVSLEQVRNVSKVRKIARTVLKIFAPLM